MARILFSGLVNSLQGSVGGTTFQRTRSGIIMKNKPLGLSSVSLLRNSRQNQLFILQQEWKDLSSTLRQKWQSFALFKKVPENNNPNRYLNGHQLFMQYNSYRLIYNHSIFTDPSFVGLNITSITCTICSNGGVMQIHVSRALVPIYEFVVLMCSNIVHQSINNAGSRYRIINFDSDVGGSINITNEYSSVFGRIPDTDETIFYKYRLIDKASPNMFPWKYVRVSVPSCI